MLAPNIGRESGAPGLCRPVLPPSYNRAVKHAREATHVYSFRGFFPFRSYDRFSL